MGSVVSFSGDTGGILQYPGAIHRLLFIVVAIAAIDGITQLAELSLLLLLLLSHCYEFSHVFISVLFSQKHFILYRPTHLLLLSQSIATVSSVIEYSYRIPGNSLQVGFTA